MTESTKEKLITIASFTCVLHCIIVPFLVMGAPLLGNFFENIFVELGILLFSIACGIAIIYNGYCKHKKKHAGIIFLIGISFWGMHTLIELLTHWHLDIELLTAGTILVLIAYRINHKQTKSCCTTHHH